MALRMSARWGLLTLCVLVCGSVLCDELGPLDEMERAIEDKTFRKIEAVLVERGGDVLYEGYFRKSTAESRIDARSVGKSITAIALGVAIDEGLIEGVDAPVLSFFDDKKPIEDDGKLKREIRIEDLLTMSSALDCNDWESSPGNEERMYRKKDWTRFALDIPLAEDYERGESGFGRYSYCTAGAFLLGRIIERASGKPFDEFVQEKLFSPLGIVDPEWRRAPNGEVQSGGQLSLRARDFAALGRLVANKGKWGSRQLVSKAWIEQMLEPRLRATPVSGYGYLWWVRGFYSGKPVEGVIPHAGYYMSGNGGNKVVVFPELDTVVVVLSTNYNHRDMHAQVVHMIQQHILPLATKSRSSEGETDEASER